MSKQSILPRKRYAIWLAHDAICSYCKEPLAYKDVWIEHIVPEHLLNAPEKLQQVLQEYELGLDFDIRDYCNLLPVHWRCNLAKGGIIFDRGATRFYINIAREKIKLVQKVERKIVRDLEQSKLIGSLTIALDEGLLSRQALIAILNREPVLKEQVEPLIITFGLNYPALWEKSVRPSWLAAHEPSDYPAVCDLLERDLLRQLKALLTCDFYYPEASGRDGETLSVRLAFVELDESEFRGFTSSWWEILEVATYSQIYNNSPDLP